MGFLPSVGEAVTWHKLQEPIKTFDFLWTVLEVEPLPEEDNKNYRESDKQKQKQQLLIFLRGRCLKFSACPNPVSLAGLKFGAVLVKPCVPLPGAQTPLVVFIHGRSHSDSLNSTNTLFSCY